MTNQARSARSRALALTRARFLTTLFFGAATGGETRGGRSWFRHDRPHSGRGGCLGGVARPDGEVKVVFFLSKNLVTFVP